MECRSAKIVKLVLGEERKFILLKNLKFGAEESSGMRQAKFVAQ